MISILLGVVAFPVLDDTWLSSIPGAVQSRFQEISEEGQSNQGQVSISVTWGIERQPRQRVTYSQTFLGSATNTRY